MSADRMDQFTRARLDRMSDCKDVSPRELLLMVLDDLDKGEIAPDGLMVIYCRRPSESAWTCGTYRTGLARDQELVQLRLAERRLLGDWLEQD